MRAGCVLGRGRRLYSTFSLAAADADPAADLYAGLEKVGLPELQEAASASREWKGRVACERLAAARRILDAVAGSNSSLAEAADHAADAHDLEFARCPRTARVQAGWGDDRPPARNPPLSTAARRWAAAVLSPFTGADVAAPDSPSTRADHMLHAVAAVRGQGSADALCPAALAEYKDAVGEAGADDAFADALRQCDGVEKVIVAVGVGRRAALAVLHDPAGFWRADGAEAPRLLAEDEAPPLWVAAGAAPQPPAPLSDDGFQSAVEALTAALNVCQVRSQSTQNHEQVHWQLRSALVHKLLMVLYARKRHYVFATGLFLSAKDLYSGLHGPKSEHVALLYRLHMPLLKAVGQAKEHAALERELSEAE